IAWPLALALAILGASPGAQAKPPAQSHPATPAKSTTKKPRSAPKKPRATDASKNPPAEPPAPAPPTPAPAPPPAKPEVDAQRPSSPEPSPPGEHDGETLPPRPFAETTQAPSGNNEAAGTAARVEEPPPSPPSSEGVIRKRSTVSFRLGYQTTNRWFRQ